MADNTDQVARKFGHYLYEDDDEFGDTKYKEKRKGAAAVAWTILGWELQADEETEWSGIYQRTGQILAVMVGDDRVHHFESKEDFIEISEDEYCGGCGQIGCGWC